MQRVQTAPDTGARDQPAGVICGARVEREYCELPRGHRGECDSFVTVPVLSYDALANIG